MKKIIMEGRKERRKSREWTLYAVIICTLSFCWTHFPQSQIEFFLFFLSDVIYQPIVKLCGITLDWVGVVSSSQAQRLQEIESPWNGKRSLPHDFIKYLQLIQNYQLHYESFQSFHLDWTTLTSIDKCVNIAEDSSANE